MANESADKNTPTQATAIEPAPVVINSMVPPADPSPEQPSNSQEPQTPTDDGEKTFKLPRRFPLYSSLAGLIIFAFVLLPWWLHKHPLITPEDVIEATETEATIQTTNEPAPWQATQEAENRRAAQEVLAEALAKRDQLKAMAVEQWAADKYQQALQWAESGDEFYKTRQFDSAIEHYQKMLSQFTELLETSETIVESNIEQGLQALADKKPDAALIAFDTALNIQPENPQALSGKEEAELLPEILNLVKSAEAKARRKDYQTALTDLKTAKSQLQAIQTQYDWLDELILNTQQKRQDQQFNTSMSLGFQAMSSGDTNVAMKAFQKAIDLNPDAENARDAYLQAKAKGEAKDLKRLLILASNAEKKEQWQQALELYNQASQLEKNQASNTARRIRAETRLKLDTELQYYLDKPMALTQEGRFAAQRWLDDAKKIKRAGKRLKQQRTQLADLIRKAGTTISVTLTSDNLSEIKVNRISDYSLFSEKTLNLKPGKYTLMARRNGYRDIRKELIIPIDGNIPPIHISCEEKLDLSLQ